MKLNDTTLIILAAGKSSRMGYPKGLISFEGQFLIEHHKTSFLKAGGEHVIIVLGSFLEEYFLALPWLKGSQGLNGLKENYLINHDVERGAFSSVQIGLQMALKKIKSKAIFILPVDVPTSPTIWSMADHFSKTFKSSKSKEVCIPCYKGRGGHPILISNNFAQSLLNVSLTSEDARLDRQIQKLPPHLIERLEVLDALIVQNLNTPNDLDQLCHQLKGDNMAHLNAQDEQFAIFCKKSAREKVDYFKRDGRVFDMIISQQIDRTMIDTLYQTTNMLRDISKTKEGAVFLQNLLPHKRAMLYFAQPSSRTFLSFENACHILGMKTSEIRDTSVSSEVKGESADDSLRTFSSYTDLVIMRHKGRDSAERAAWLLNTFSNRPVPVINGGSGADQHPTQALLDIYTLQRSFHQHGGLDGKTILMVGDLKRGRTVRSLSYLMKNFKNMRLIFAAPKAFQMESDIFHYLDEHQINYTIETESIENVLHLADAIYMTRIQDEHDDVANPSSKVNTENFKLRLKHMKTVKPTAVILHPFPRRDEIDVAIDPDPRAKYWRQERNGMWMRAALIAFIFNVHEEIIHYSGPMPIKRF